MKLNKAQESEILKIYGTYFDSYIRGDTKTISSLLDDDYNQIGSADGEVFYNKKDALKFLMDTIDQVAGKTQIRNRVLRVDPLETFILVTDLFDIYVMIDSDWSFYSRFRASTLMQKKDNGWKFIHQHSSMPDSKTQEGENIAIEKIAEENLQLREAVRRRTVELEQRNRELQIESSVERIRAKALSMHRSEEILNVVAILRQELESLKIPGITASTIHLKQENGKIRIWDLTELNESESGFHFSIDFEFMLEETPEDLWFRKPWAIDEKYSVVPGTKKEFLATAEWIHQFDPDYAEKTRQFIESSGLTRTWHPTVTLSGGRLCVDFIQPPPAEMELILLKIGAAFDLAYKRFHDLKKAEAQTRESKIQLSLERVRARSMAMNSSEELSDVLSVLFEQFDILGIKPSFAHLTLFDVENDTFSFRMTGLAGQRILVEQIIDIDQVEAWQSSYQQWKEGDENRVNCIDYPPEALPQIWEIMAEIFDALPEGSKMRIEDFPKGIYTTQGHCKFGYLGFNHTRRATEEEKEIVVRFATEFGRLYQRYLDIQKAEAQAREAQISLSLERVRARAMAMQNSEELNEVLSVLFNQFDILDINPKFAFLTLMDIPNNTFGLRITGKKGYRNIGEQTISLDAMDLWADTVKRWKDSLPHTHQNLIYPPESIPQLFEVLAGVIESVPEEARFQIEDFPDGLYSCEGHCKYGYIGFANSRKVSDEEIDIVIRFAKEFEQVYQRFLDLTKAETQAREAQIEAALERVRTRSMAMHNSEELVDASDVLFQEIENLGIDAIRTGIALIDGKKNTVEVWSRSEMKEQVENRILGMVPAHIHPMYQGIIEAWKKKEPYFAYQLEGEDLVSYYKKLASYLTYPKRKKYNKKETIATYFFPEGSLNVISHRPLNEDQNDIMVRFARVFGQMYRRFLDLKKAEDQAREAQIEASLERVRGKAMAIRQSDELREVIALVFNELKKLGFGLYECNIIIVDKKRNHMTTWGSGMGQADLPVSYTIEPFDHPFLNEFFRDFKSGVKYRTAEMYGESNKKYLDQFFSQPDLKKIPNEYKKAVYAIDHVYLSHAMMSHGCLEAAGSEPLPDDKADLLKRFAKVVDLTYTRIDDIVQAEARARESAKQASLDRIRAEIASMRTSNDLELITPLIWKELNSLEVPFIRCGVFIMDETREIIHNYLSTPEGRAIAAFHLPYDTPGFIAHVLDHWQEKIMYLEHWDEVAMAEFAGILVQQDIFKSPEQYLSTLPQEGFYLHLLPFQQGMLYVGNLSPLDNEQLDLLQSLANAFATAYARYDDFNRLELAKMQVDKALVDLKQAQQQLIQSEKMASLGELTAGIAHEIQNPLNFVNNFSELNGELLEEMEEALRSGDKDEAIALAKDISDNQQKINMHGKRAEGIVKGMLQHSRNNPGQKELTDINALCDEYLRLAYHGMRAKDKSFNAGYKLELDKSLPMLNVISQDIGRVLLNLINNAFYAVARVVNPEVIVTTNKLDGVVEICVKDNGQGIPDEIKDKIFQPFFTTKPTGQGTGLGLSLSYDIMNAHGGNIEVNSIKNKGTEFIITIPQDI